ncbi:Protein N-acetyltransferase, RimJ/RimL family [Novosphingobium sp. CF614]|uniref:GNAT family N-acetyltransferase n=1 Tax=Novosphingobium sp. CF614 TaxID=1884364 RepID=UPI0008ED0168|nr:GNAT family N-acetyltransferase [Novosphingobium sp. CF614]SFG16890.1 Protein N-acetyltransferase, RimJ/RimL family [Novosphingobium sp. CF614]
MIDHLRLSTERLLLRMPARTDAPRLHIIASDPRVALTTASIPHPYPAEGAEEFIGRIHARCGLDWRSLAIIDLMTDDLIGMVGFVGDGTSAELTYMIAPSRWGQGIATEASSAVIRYLFDQRGYRMVTATAMTTNPASARVLQKLGFEKAGKAPREIPLRGSIHLISSWRLNASRSCCAPLRTHAFFREVEGAFFRSILADRIDDVLAPPRPESAGRYHRPGQATLYMSPLMDWAKIAVSGYIREDGRPRVVIPLTVGKAHVLDQHDEVACRSRGIDREHSNAPWRSALLAGAEPPSWRNADFARVAGADGIIDRSRNILGGWHLNLFRWNELGGPCVKVCGKPEPIHLSADGPKWGL